MVPSQVVAAIDSMFGPNRNELNQQMVRYTHVAQVATLLGLLDRVPDQLLTLSPADLVDFNLCRSSLEIALYQWRAYGQGEPAKNVGQKDPVERIRRHLVTCPDQMPPEIALPFVLDQETRRGIEERITTAWVNFRVSDWSGATVFAGTAVEGLLLWLARDRLSQPSNTRMPKKPIDELHLSDLINLADQGSWLSASALGQLRLTQDARNLIHPGRCVRLGKVCSRATALTALAGVYAIVEELL
jgi:hypothetical protein